MVIEPKTEDLWDCITALGAQLSRPPYDPYREIIDLDISIGRRQCLQQSYFINAIDNL